MARPSLFELFNDDAVRDGIAAAWRESMSEDPLDRHEEGGYVVRDSRGSLAVERWPRGEQARITPSALDETGCYNGRVIVAAFHTHPNPAVDEEGRTWEEQPSRSDRRWHGNRRIPGIVISRTFVYWIDENGEVSISVSRHEVF